MKWFDKLEDTIIGGLLVLITLMVFFEVFCRFVLNSEGLVNLGLANQKELWAICKADGIALAECSKSTINSIVTFGRHIQIWIQEATLYLAGWMVLLGASWAVREKAHICMDAVTTRVSEKTERIMTLIGLVICFIYCGFFIYGSFFFLKKLHQIGIEMNDIAIPKWIAESVLIIGFVLLVFRFAQLGIRVFKGEENGFYEHKHAGMEDLEPIKIEETK